MSRRAFLATTAGAAGAIAIGTGVTNFLSTVDVKARVVIIGGGAAGCSLAARLMRKIEHPDITLIDPADKQFYQPGFTFIAAGIFQPDEVWKRQEDCLPRGDGFKWVKERVVAVDPDKRQVATDGNKTFDYDFLVLTPGLQLNWDKIEGVTKETLAEVARVGNAHCIYDFEGAQRIWPAIQQLTDKGGRGIYTDTHTKHKCGGAPKKICMLTEHLARQKGTRGALQLNYFCSEKQLYDVPYYTPRLLEIYEERGIQLEVRHKVKGIDIAKKEVHLQPYQIDEAGKSVDLPDVRIEPYDLLSFVPPQSAPDFVRESGLSWQEGKLAKDAWVEVDEETLIHPRYPNIVSFGDVAGIGTSKTSAAVRKQLPIVQDNLLAIMQGKEPTAKYNGYACCPIVTDYNHVLLCEFDYKKNPDITFPFSLLNMSKEQWAAMLLKRYFLKPMFFHGMLPGLM
ncbi:MAG: NAD(P)/FAD-dependent oxidoreductase [Bacteroidaceae bacterium]|nr:NAD(P)/FAD-dependent oxidoreductase [Bacteroidaceae bacterium]